MEAIKSLYKKVIAERKRKQWLNEKLEGLTDDSFLDQVMKEEVESYLQETTPDENLQTVA